MSTPADVTASVNLLLDAFREVSDDAWDTPARDLNWTCWETVEHIADDLFAYAGQLSTNLLPSGDYVRFGWRANREGGPEVSVWVQREAGTTGLLQALDVCGSFLSLACGAAPAGRVAFHPYGNSDASGFAAMGVVETLVHGYDAAEGLGLAFEPPADLCGRALARIFHDIPVGDDPWRTLLWATGRIPLGEAERRENWRWNGVPR